jgi:hypothetical protein
VNFLVTLQQARPIFGLEILLSQDHLNVGGGVVGFGVVNIDLTVEFNLEVICGLLGI